MNDFEKKRLENIQRNNEILKSLGLTENILPLNEKVKLKTPKTVKRKREAVVEPTRRSLRARGQQPDGSEKVVEKVESDKEEKLEGDVQFDDESQFFRSINEEEDKKWQGLTGKYSNFKIPFSMGTIKVTLGMIYSIAPYPSSSKLMAAAGDKTGNIAIWDIDHSLETHENEDFEPSIYSIKSHKGPVMKLLYRDKNSIISSSQDGSLRSFDCQKLVSTLVFAHPSKHAIGHFDFRENEMWYSTHYGKVGMIDPREREAHKTYEASERKLNTMVFHPTKKDYFLTAGLDGFVRIFDVRNLKTDSLLDPIKFYKHTKSCNSAFWSPDGKHILSTSFDNTLGLWKNVFDNEERIKIRHNNNTGQWIQKFKAVWNPKSDTIMVGNMQRKVDLFDIHGRPILQLEDDDKLTAIPAVNVFHNNVDLILSGNASGKMTIWR